MKKKIKLPTTKIKGVKSKLKFSRKMLALAAVAVLLIGTATVYGNLHAQNADRGGDPVNGMNYEKKQVLLSGQGYKLDKEQKKEYALEKQKENKKEEDLFGGRSSILSPFSGFRGSAFSAYRPVISSNLRTQKIETNEEYEFYVMGKTYNKDAIDPKYYTVKYNKKTLTPTKVEEEEAEVTTTTGGKVKKTTKTYFKAYYTITVVKGAKNVDIAVKDPKKKETTKGTYVITGTKERPKVGEIEIAIDVTNLSNDSVADTIVCKKEDTVKTLLDKIASEYGYKITLDTGTNKRIKSITGIKVVKDAREYYKQLCEEGAYGTNKYVDPAKGTLKNDDFVKGSRWVIYNGAKELKYTAEIKEGMKIRIVFVIPEPVTPGPDVDPTDPTDPTEGTQPGGGETEETPAP